MSDRRDEAPSADLPLPATPAAGEPSRAAAPPAGWPLGTGHVLLAGTLTGIGVAGLAAGRLIAIWQGVPAALPRGAALGYLCACVSLACGLGLLVPRVAVIAARALVAYLLLWLLLIKAPPVIASPAVEGVYQSAGETAVLVAGAWVLYAWLAGAWDARHVGFALGDAGVRLARVLYALALIAFGLSHFAYVRLTAPLVPAWLPAHGLWAYLTGGAYLAAAVAILSGVLSRLAATLSAVQMALFTLLVWVPPLAAGHPSAGQYDELGVSLALTAAACVMADSFRGRAWLATPGR